MIQEMLIREYDGSKTINSPMDIFNRCQDFKGMAKEIFKVFLLDSNNAVIASEIISIGTLNLSIVHPREVFRLAIIKAAAALILLHNHPSGNTEPSEEDIKVTEQLRKAGELLGIKVLDHVIISGKLDGYRSIM
jgi:DNA repair protein RadC